MPNSNGELDRQYIDAAQAQLGERVTNLNRRQTDLENEMRVGFRQIESSFASFTNETRASIQALSATIAEKNKPQWQALSVMLAAVVAIGGLAYMPIREATTDLKTSVANTITRQEMDWRQARGAEDRSRADRDLTDLRSQMVPREELDRVFLSYDDQMREKQRQLDELKQAQGSVYGQRDAMMDMRERLDRLERERRAALTP
ncbi:hypothetical protein QBK99_10915 [Corticibacterium sp. UT-5YL-CI-8]|nr:hypothetical protein [Tianweitania sp. UT-5YL-CI-8]